MESYEAGTEDDTYKEQSAIMTREDDMQRITEMRDKLYNAAKAYYQGNGDSPLSDDEYDAGIEWLRDMATKYDLSDDATIQGLIGGVAASTETTAPASAKVIHSIPMLSLKKAKTRDEVEAYLRRLEKAGATGFKLQAKFDGIACSAVYTNGVLTGMSTRGDGITGEDMSYLIDNADVTINGLPSRLGTPLEDSSSEIRGELFMRPSEFRKLNERRKASGEELFANARNTNAGIVKRAASGLDGDKAVLQFVMYRIIGDNTEDEYHTAGVATASTVTLDEWHRTGVPIPGDSLEIRLTGSDAKSYASVTDKTMSVIDAFDGVRPLTDLSLDGIVVKPLNEKEMDDKLGSNSHDPNSQIAFKYKGATGSSTIASVEVSVGKSGRLTPIATFNPPVDIGGTTVTKATLNNYQWVKDNGIRIGSVVQVERSNDVIPKVDAVLYSPDDSRPLTVPNECPYCGGPITGMDDRVQYCRNESCPARGSYMLKAAAAKTGLNFDGLGDVVVDALHDSGLITDVSDFYDLTEQELADVTIGSNQDGTPRRFGEKRAEHVMEYIEKSKSLPFHRVLASLSIDGLGRSTAKALTKKYSDINELMSASEEDIASIDGLGEIKAHKLKTSLERRRSLIERLMKAGLQFTENVAQTPSEGVQKASGGIDGNNVNTGDNLDTVRKALSGVRISITGSVPEGFSNRDEWREFVDMMGGISQTSPNKDTDYLIWDGARTSSKLAKARKNGTRIISPADFTKAMDTGSFPSESTYDEEGNYVG